MALRILQKRNSGTTEDGNPVLPSVDDLLYGELAVNYGAGVESLSIRNSANEIVSMSINGLAQTISDALAMHEARNDNPHGVTKTQIGLGNVDNTADMDKPISTAQQTELDKKLANAENGGVIDNLTTNDSSKALSAAQGIVLQGLIEQMTGGAIADLQALERRVAEVEEEISGATQYIDSTLMPKAQEVHNIINS